MYKLYNIKTWGSLAPHLLLDELGVPYQNIWLTEEQIRQPQYMAINPLGKVPALELPDGRTVTESCAIVAFLTDAHTDKRLAPAPGELTHAVYLSQLVFMSVNIYQALNLCSGTMGLTETPEQAATVMRLAAGRSNMLFDLVETNLAKEGPYILGERYSAADIYLFMLSLWARPSELAHLQRCPHIAAVVAAVRARPKLKSALEAHGVMQIGGYSA